VLRVIVDFLVGLPGILSKLRLAFLIDTGLDSGTQEWLLRRLLDIFVQNLSKSVHLSELLNKVLSVGDESISHGPGLSGLFLDIDVSSNY